MKFIIMPLSYRIYLSKPSTQLYLFRSILFVVITSLNSLNAQWQKVPIQTTEMLYDIDFHNNQIILGSYKGIYHSTDQGFNWSVIPIDQGFDIPYHILGVKFINSVSMVATGFFLDGNSQIVYKSANNGMTWSKVYENNFSTTPIRALYNIDFPSLKIGYAVGINNSVIKTIDYGASWQSVYNIDNLLTDVNFTDNDHGIVGGTRKFAITVDGGINWRTFGTNSDISSVCCASPALFYVSTESYLLKTMDQGINWDTIRSSVYDCNDILSIGQDSLLVATDHGIYFSESGGRYWEVFSETKNLNFNKIKNNNSTFWAIGKNGLIMNCSKLIGLKPISGFQYKLPPPPHCEPMKVIYKNLGSPKWDYEWLLNDTLISRDYEISQDITQNNAAQRLTLITKSAQAIDTFKKEFLFQVKRKPHLQIQDSIFSCSGIANLIDATDASLIKYYLWRNESTNTEIGYDSKIKISIDNSTIFSLIATSFEGCRDTAKFFIHIDTNFQKDLWIQSTLPNEKFRLTDIEFVDRNIGYALAPAHKILLKTIDGGKNWESIPTNIAFVNRGSIEFINDSIGWIAAEGIYKTTDGGKSWKPDDLQAEEASFVKFRNSMEGIAIRIGKVGSSVSSVYATENGGITWSKKFNSSSYLYSADFSKDGVWYCVGGYGNQGFIYKSLDGGATWSQPIFLEAGITQLSVVDRDRVYFITQNNKVFYTSDGGNSFTSQILRSGGLYDIKMLDSLYGYILGNNVIYKTADGGNCWNVYKYVDGNNAIIAKFHMLTNDIGYIAVTDEKNINKSYIYQLERGPYFNVESPICLPGEYKIQNYSDINGYEDYLWYQDNIFVSNDYDLILNNLKAGDNIIKLVAINGNRRDSITRNIVGSQTPGLPKLTVPYTKFCGGSLDTLIIVRQPGLDYHWNLEPIEAASYIQANNDTLIVYWRFDDPNIQKARLSAYALNTQNCVSDSLIFDLPLLLIPDLQFTPDILQYYCVDSKTLKKSFKVSVYPIEHDTLEWFLDSGGPDWQLRPISDTAVLSVNLINNYYPGIISVKSKNACYDNTIIHNFEVVGPPEILDYPKSQSIKSGEEVYLSILIDSWKDLGITYSLYQDNKLRIRTQEDEIFVTSNFSSNDEGLYYIEVDNGCFITRTPDFKLSLVTDLDDLNDSPPIKLFPNPFKGELNLQFSNLDINPNSIQINDIEGRSIDFKYKLAEKGVIIIIDFERKGFYILKCISLDKSVSIIPIYSN